MPTSFLVRAAGAAVILIALPLAGCESDRSLMSTAPAPAPAAAKPVAPAINMAGRWTLASPGGGMCAMTFTSKAGGAEGNIAPEGGCPGQFYTSRHWALDSGGLSIIDHKGGTLAHLASSNPPGQFQGQAASGIPVSLAR
jgi:hypothetical protein